MLNVSFITCETGTDLIVSYAIPTGELWYVHSLILMRTPELEMFLYPHERGVNVSYEDDDEPDDDEYEMLKSIQISANTVQIETDRRTFHLNVEKVKQAERGKMLQVLAKMNFDNSFKLIQ